MVIGVIGISGVFTLFSFKKIDNVKAQVTAQSEPKIEKKNLAIEIALHDFKNLEEFNTKFFDTSDETWMIPDVSPEGSNDGGNSHGWTSFPAKENAKDSDIIDNNTGKTIYTTKASDGATAGEIRETLVDRDNAKKD